MHVELTKSRISCTSPWEAEPLAMRLSELLAGRDDFRVAYLYEVPDTSTFRYRVYNMVEALRTARPRVSATWFQVSEATALGAHLRDLDVLVLSRIRYSRTIGDLIVRARAFGVRILAECDDLVFSIRHAHLVAVNNDQPTDSHSFMDRWYAYCGRLSATVSHCDGGIATNDVLAEHMETVCGGPVAVVPNFLNREQEELSRRLLAVKQNRGFRSTGRTVIGYFSGSPTHNQDFAIALPAIKQLMAEDEEVGLRIVGFMESFSELADLGSRVERISLQNYMNLQVAVAEVDVNIAPLQLNDFTNCKSELKFFEAAAVGTYTCASPNHSFTSAISSPYQGILCEAGDWLRSLREAVAFARNSETYAGHAIATAEAVYDRYGWDRNVDAILDAVAPD